MKIILDDADKESIEKYEDNQAFIVTRDAKIRSVKFRITDPVKANNFMCWLAYMSSSAQKEELTNIIGCYAEQIGLSDSFTPSSVEDIKKKLHEFIEEIIQ